MRSSCLRSSRFISIRQSYSLRSLLSFLLISIFLSISCWLLLASLLHLYRLPDSVFWFEPPVVAHWLPEKEMWSTKHVHDVKFNEEKQTITFRTGRLGIHGLAGYKYANLPFQSWELKPEMGKSGREHAGVVLNITAATIQAEFVVRASTIAFS